MGHTLYSNPPPPPPPIFHKKKHLFRTSFGCLIVCDLIEKKLVLIEIMTALFLLNHILVNGIPQNVVFLPTSLRAFHDFKHSSDGCSHIYTPLSIRDMPFAGVLFVSVLVHFIAIYPEIPDFTGWPSAITY